MDITQVRTDVLAALGREVNDEADLLDEGLDSIRIMTLVEKWRREGHNISFVDLFEDPTIAAWTDLLN